MSDNQNDIPTPRTDAEYKRRVQLYPQSVTTHEVVNISFARTLERENVKLKESFNQSQEARQKWIAEFVCKYPWLPPHACFVPARPVPHLSNVR